MSNSKLFFSLYGKSDWERSHGRNSVSVLIIFPLHLLSSSLRMEKREIRERETKSFKLLVLVYFSLSQY